MAEQIKVHAADRLTAYKELIPQIDALITGEPDLIANLANVTAALKTGLNFFWVGFYLVKGNELVLGPFQGPVACTRIAKGKGVCGTAWQKNEVIVVPDVNEFPGHIACSSESRSEIVLPLRNKKGEVIGVLDADSDKPNDFGEADARELQRVVDLLVRNL